MVGQCKCGQNIRKNSLPLTVGSWLLPLLLIISVRHPIAIYRMTIKSTIFGQGGGAKERVGASNKNRGDWGDLTAHLQFPLGKAICFKRPKFVKNGCLQFMVAIACVVLVWATAYVLGFGEGVLDGVVTRHDVAVAVVTNSSHNLDNYRFWHTT